MESQVFDYIVVGAGSAGSVLANRLSADPKNRVLVLEAGREGHPWSRIPIGFARLIQNPAANWLYSSEPDEGTGQRRIPIPRGKLLGGSSSINGMVFVRGQSQDYDTWAQLGNRGWSYREVLPIFKDMESYQGEGDDEYRGRTGPLRVSENNETGALYDALIKAAGEIGIAYTQDYNGARQDGIGMTQTTIRGGRRMSTEHSSARPAGALQVLPWRPRPANCSLAVTTVPCGAPPTASARARSLVESVTRKWTRGVPITAPGPRPCRRSRARADGPHRGGCLRTGARSGRA